MDELLLELIYPYLNFKMFHKLRITCKTIMDFTEKPYYWEVINFTDLPHHTFSNCLIDFEVIEKKTLAFFFSIFFIFSLLDFL